MSQSTTPTVQNLRHKIRKYLFVASVRMTGVSGLSQDQQLANIDAAIALNEKAGAKLAEMRELVLSRKVEFEALAESFEGDAPVDTPDADDDTAKIDAEFEAMVKNASGDTE